MEGSGYGTVQGKVRWTAWGDRDPLPLHRTIEHIPGWVLRFSALLFRGCARGLGKKRGAEDPVSDENATSPATKPDSGSKWMARRPHLVKELETKTFQVKNDGSMAQISAQGEENVPPSALFDNVDRPYLTKPNQLKKRPCLATDGQ